LRYNSADEGTLQVVVAPVLRFKDVGINSNITVEDLAPPENLIAGELPGDGLVLRLWCCFSAAVPWCFCCGAVPWCCPGAVRQTSRHLCFSAAVALVLLLWCCSLVLPWCCRADVNTHLPAMCPTANPCQRRDWHHRCPAPH
jgi:hypothetical protein